MFASGISAARAAFDKQHPGISGTFTQVSETVTLVGVPMFDFLHGQSGVAQNGIEIHAILDLCFGKDCAGGTATLSLDPGTAQPGTVNLTITGTSGNLTHMLSVAWTIPVPTRFSMIATPPTVSSPAGAVATSTISSLSAPQGGVSLAVSNVPAGATATFRPTGTGSSVLMLDPGSAAQGDYSIVVSGIHGTQSAQVTVAWSVQPANGDFTLSVTPAAQTAAPGASVTYTVNTSGLGQISLSTSDAPAGTTVSFAPASVPAGQSSMLTIAIAASAALGTSLFHVDAASAVATHSAGATLTVAAGPDTTPPVAQITSPSGGSTVTGAVAVTASATDDVGVTRMEIDADGASIGTGSGAALTASWNTSGAAAGLHTLTAKAWDAAGNVGTSSPVQVTVTRGGGIRTVFLIVLENHNWSQIKGSASAPYINGTLLKQGSYAENYSNLPGIHPSEPNYLWLEAGTSFGVTNDALPSANHQSTTQHLSALLEAKGLAWKSYQEDITGTTCPLTNSGLYAPKHNAFVFFDDVNGGLSTTSSKCIQHVRPYSELAGDLQNGRVANYNFITPNLCNDMHNASGCATSDSIKNGDTWLSQAVPTILASAAYKSGGALFITFDESEGGDFPIMMVVLSPQAKGGGYSNTIAYSHSSMLRTVQEIFGVTPLLGDAANATDLSDLFIRFP